MKLREHLEAIPGDIRAGAYNLAIGRAESALKAFDEAEWSTLYAATTEGPDQPHYFLLVPDPAPPTENA